MDDVGARQNLFPIINMTVLSRLQMRYDKIYLVNESCFVQQRLGATCIATDALRSLTAVKLIRRLHGGFSLRFYVVEEFHATAFELRILSEAVVNVTKNETCLFVLS